MMLEMDNSELLILLESEAGASYAEEGWYLSDALWALLLRVLVLRVSGSARVRGAVQSWGAPVWLAVTGPFPCGLQDSQVPSRD